jgi:peptidoglycan/LPS O-acetylase OafA/YrhL
MATHTRLPERNLDVLRAIAVLCVVTDHVLWACNLSLPFMSDWDLGRVGVLLFFVHTSLVLMSSLERAGPRVHWVRDFYIRRAFRIYPLAIAAVIATVIFRIPPIVPADYIAPSARTFVSNILLVQNISGDGNIMGMIWTLPIEVQMYVVLPVFYLLARRSIYHVLTAMVAAAVFGLVVQYVPTPGLWRLTVGLFAPCFVSGVLAFTILRTMERPKLPAWTWVPLLIIAIPLFVVLRPSPDRPEPGWIMCIAVAIAIPFVKELGDSQLTRVAKTICTYSYGTYLLLTPAIWIAFDVASDWPRMIQWVVLGVALIGLPWIAYTVIEHPGILLGRHLVRYRQQLGATTPAP